MATLLVAACGAPSRVPVPPPAEEPVEPEAPNPDRDGDGLLDIDDQCPCDMEDVDGFEDEDGCPEPDNDRDRIVDVCDFCPNDPENYNGIEDLDGCPDMGRVIISSSRIQILERIYFLKNRAEIRPRSHPILDAVAAVMQAYPDIELVELQGHASTRERRPDRLSQRRADAVRDALIQRGVEPQRLVARAYGTSRPIASNDTADGRERNRRAEFSLERRAVPPAPTPTPTPTPPSQPPANLCPDGQPVFTPAPCD